MGDVGTLSLYLQYIPQFLIRVKYFFAPFSTSQGTVPSDLQKFAYWNPWIFHFLNRKIANNWPSHRYSTFLTFAEDILNLNAKVGNDSISQLFQRDSWPIFLKLIGFFKDLSDKASATQLSSDSSLSSFFRPNRPLLPPPALLTNPPPCSSGRVPRPSRLSESDGGQAWSMPFLTKPRYLQRYNWVAASLH